jgi:phosphoribosylformylglycinamidine synthase
VIRPKANSKKGVVLSGGMQTRVADPYWMALASIDEAIRNAVCVGAKLDTLAILDNFCWPGVHDEVSMGTLVRACEACRDGAIGYRVPFISGKDSLHNQFTDAASGRVTRIPNTLLISAIGVIDDVSKCMTSHFKKPGNAIYRITTWDGEVTQAADVIAARRAVHQLVSEMIASGLVVAAHDISDGGTLVAAAEMAIGGNLGVELRASRKIKEIGWFAEHEAGYLLEIAQGRAGEIAPMASAVNVFYERIGTVEKPREFDEEPTLTVVDDFSATIDSLTKAWRGTLDW